MKLASTRTAVVLAATLAAGLFAGNSFAADQAGLSREQVRAAYVQARAEGSLAPIGEAQAPVAAKVTVSTLTREAVRADYLAAQKAGTLAPIGEATEVRVNLAPSALTRAEVKAEYFSARKAGTLPTLGDHA